MLVCPWGRVVAQCHGSIVIPEEKCKQFLVPLGQEVWSTQILRTNAFSSLLHLGLFEKVLKKPTSVASYDMLLWDVCVGGGGAHKRGGAGDALLYVPQRYQLHSSISCSLMRSWL